MMFFQQAKRHRQKLIARLEILQSVSASSNRRSENVVIEAIVIFELAFRDIERQIFAADFVITANNRPFEDRPEAFNRVGVN